MIRTVYGVRGTQQFDVLLKSTKTMASHPRYA